MKLTPDEYAAIGRRVERTPKKVEMRDAHQFMREAFRDRAALWELTQEAKRLCNKLAELDWCIGYEFDHKKENHEILSEARTLASALLESLGGTDG